MAPTALDHTSSTTTAAATREGKGDKSTASAVTGEGTTKIAHPDEIRLQHPPGGHDKERDQNASSTTDGGQDDLQDDEREIEEPALEDGAERSHSLHSTSSSHRQRRSRNDFLLQVSTYAALVVATICGVLARLGLTWIGEFAEGEVFARVWPQLVGCFVMGLVVDREKKLEELYAPLFVACGTGFCGSLTTFSSWMVDVFVAFAAIDSPGQGRFSSFLSGLAITIVTLAVSTSSLQLGVHLSSFLPHRPSTRTTSKKPPTLPYHISTILLGTLFYIGAILLLVLAPAPWRSRATFAIVLGPPGTFLRYSLSQTLNSRYPSFPLGTFLANSIAVLLFSITALLQRRQSGSGVDSPPSPSSLGCAALQGIQDGFCGALSTVSTFVVELRGLGRKDAWRYFWVSWAVGQGILVVVLGSWEWTGERGKCSV